MVRRAIINDAQVLAAIHVTSWQATYKGIFSDEFLAGLDPNVRVPWFSRQIENGASILVAPDEAPQGFCWFGDPFAEEDETGWAEVYSIYVHPEQWGAGHGYQLLNTAEYEMAAAGYERVFLWVLDRNLRARDFYERQGWRLAKPLKLEEIGGVQITEVRYELDLSERTRPA